MNSDASFKSRLMPGARLALLLGAVALLAAGCGNRVFNNNERLTFDGVEFRTRSETRDKADKKSFTVTVQPVSASLDGAREAGRWEGTRYCIRKYGSSKIDWEIGPETDAAQLPVADDKLTLRGRCDP